MTSEPSVLFITYSRTEPVTQIGVLKRVCRLVDHLDIDWDIHLFNMGELPEGDPLIDKTVETVTFHEIEEPDYMTFSLFLRRLSPDHIVMGEAPLYGDIRAVASAARDLGASITCIENFYGAGPSRLLPLRWSGIDRWFLLGPVPSVGAELEDGIHLYPPLLDLTDLSDTATAPSNCLLGYDEEILSLGEQIVSKSHRDGDWAAIVPGASEERVSALEELGVDVVDRFPGHHELVGYLSGADLVVAKNGFQQVAECLVLGDRVIAGERGGGFDPGLIPGAFREDVLFVDPEDDAGAMLDDVEAFLARESTGPRLLDIVEGRNLIDEAAAGLAEIVEDATAGTAGARAKR